MTNFTCYLMGLFVGLFFGGGIIIFFFKKGWLIMDDIDEQDSL